MNAFIVFDAESGAIDGIYFDRKLADEMLLYWQEEISGRWSLLQVLSGQGGIPDHLFAARMLRP